MKYINKKIVDNCGLISKRNFQPSSESEKISESENK